MTEQLQTSVPLNTLLYLPTYLKKQLNYASDVLITTRQKQKRFPLCFHSSFHYLSFALV